MKLTKAQLKRIIKEQLKEESAVLKKAKKQPGSSPAAETFIKGHEKGLESFVTMLKQIASDPKFRELAFAGRDDAAGPADEAIQVSPGTPVAAKGLTPTQKDIDFHKSFGDQMTNKFNSTVYALEDPITMGSPGGRIPLLVYNNKFILDGHHRW